MKALMQTENLNMVDMMESKLSLKATLMKTMVNLESLTIM